MTNTKATRNGSIKKGLDASNQVKKFTLGDIVWTRTRSGSWWPCQIVDERRVLSKLMKNAKDGVLVRMYGCYEYSYVDPKKCSAEFEKALKQDNLTIREAFQKAIDEDLSRIRSGSKSKRKATDSKEGTEKQAKKDGTKAKRADNKKDGIPAVKSKNPKNSKVSIESKTPGTGSAGLLSPDSSERRTKVMQRMGLIAPIGSPYRPSGSAISSLL